MTSGDGGGPDEPKPQDWGCAECATPTHRVIGVAALIEGQLRFWVEAFCPAHEQAVRDVVEAQVRKGRPPEILVRKLLAPAEVDAWMHHVRREAGVG